MSRVRSYRDKELLDRVKTLDSYQGIPDDYWILGVEAKGSNNEFNDKFYMFKGYKFISVVYGTTNPGLVGLKQYQRYNSIGCAVVKTEEWYYGLWAFGLHKGRMEALKQVRPIKYYRDGNKDDVVDRVGKVYNKIIGINFHTVSYKKAPLIKRFIGGWSTGCQVVNDVVKYYKMLGHVKKQTNVTFCLIKEF